MTKSIDDHFHDWEGETFGFSYGTGEEFIIPQVLMFLSTTDAEGRYDHRDVEIRLGPVVAWLLINALCKAEVIEYGTSPRHGWLTDSGKALKAYVAGKQTDDLLAALQRDPDYIECYRDYCNCGDGPCSNPFWATWRGPHKAKNTVKTP